LSGRPFERFSKEEPMSRIAWLVPALLAGTATVALAQHEHGKPGVNTMTDAQKIASAMSAAPSDVSAKATIMDWPAADGQPPRQLRASARRR
jgi:hypothetical protein